jgi:site-specific DNA-methyltransferase (adenine-specific)
MAPLILQGDCREALRGMKSASVDACITDPPYGETSLAWDLRVDGWLPEVRRVLKPGGSLWCCGSLRFFMERAADFSDWTLVQDVVWEKHNGSNCAADRFRRVHELAVQFRPADRPWAEIYRDPQSTPDAVARQVRRKKGPAHWGEIGEHRYTSVDGGPRMMLSVIYARSAHGRAIHPTQKPEALLEPLIRYSCPPGGIVLDPFMGSGSTGVAASRQGREFIGIEVDPAMCEDARARLANAEPLLASVGRVA